MSTYDGSTRPDGSDAEEWCKRIDNLAKLHQPGSLTFGFVLGCEISVAINAAVARERSQIVSQCLSLKREFKNSINNFDYNLIIETIRARGNP